MRHLSRDGVALAGRLDRHGAAERLPVPDRDHDAGHKAELAEIPEALGLALVDAPDLDRLTDGDVRERRAHELMDGAVGIGDRVAVWIDGRMPQRNRHTLDQRVRHGMLQPLGLRVDGVPAVAEEPDQVRLDEAVAADHPKGGAACSSRPSSESRLTIPLTEGALSSSKCAMSLVEAGRPSGLSR